MKDTFIFALCLNMGLFFSKKKNIIDPKILFNKISPLLAQKISSLSRQKSMSQFRVGLEVQAEGQYCRLHD